MKKYLAVLVLLLIAGKAFAGGMLPTGFNPRYDVDNRQWSKNGVNPNYLLDANGQKIENPQKPVPAGYVWPKYSSKYTYNPSKLEYYGECSYRVKCIN